MLYCKLLLITYNFIRGLRRAYDWNRKSSSKQVTTVMLIKIRFTFTNQISGLSLIKRRGPGISPGYYVHLPRLLSKENERKIEPKEIPSCLIPRLLVVFTWQLEILVTTLKFISIHI